MMIREKRHRAPVVTKLMVIGLALLVIVSIWVRNVSGLRESMFDFVDGVGVATGVVDPDANTNSRLHLSLTVQTQVTL